jgi:hypothetical protein
MSREFLARLRHVTTGESLLIGSVTNIVAVSDVCYSEVPFPCVGRFGIEVGLASLPPAFQSDAERAIRSLSARNVAMHLSIRLQSAFHPTDGGKVQERHDKMHM